MTIDIPALRSAALAATPGPWHTDADLCPDDVVVWAGPRGDGAIFLGNVGENDARPVGIIFDVEARNGRFIAAASPSVVLALLDLIDEWTAAESCQQAECDDLQARLTAAEARLASAEGVVEAYREYAKTSDPWTARAHLDRALRDHDANAKRDGAGEKL
jgi:hypothetical protein